MDEFNNINENTNTDEQMNDEVIPEVIPEMMPEEEPESASSPASPIPDVPYTPAQNYPPYIPKEPVKKESKYAKLSTVIAVSVIAVILCAAAGFGGTLLANRISSSRFAKTDTVTENTPLVIYRSTDEITTSTGTNGNEELTYAEVAALVKDSVVEINTEYTTRSAWFQYVNSGAGSGVIISEDGYIVTNAHVILKEQSTTPAETITVRLVDGNEFTAKLIGYDTEADIAILKIDATGLKPAECGNSSNLVVGEELIVVGNPLGSLGGSVTNGIVSATEREIEVNGTVMTLIQTNAAVNPGNSGGGMFNMKGQLVGIVNAKSSGASIEGLGFAIPVNSALEVTEQLIEYGYVRGKVTIGITFKTVSGNTFYNYYNIKPGIYVQDLVKGMNDDVMKVGDRVIAINGSEITSFDDIKAVVSTCKVGDTITFQLYRDQKLTEVTVTCFEKTPTAETPEVDFDDEAPTNDNGFGNFFGDYSSGNIEDFFNEFFR